MRLCPWIPNEFVRTPWPHKRLCNVVVRTRTVGHFFPAGTVDAFHVWLELQASDEKG
jgi:hypothetical protein